MECARANIDAREVEHALYAACASHIEAWNVYNSDIAGVYKIQPPVVHR